MGRLAMLLTGSRPFGCRAGYLRIIYKLMAGLLRESREAHSTGGPCEPDRAPKRLSNS